MLNQENVEGDQPVQSHSHVEHPLQKQTCVQEHCAGETGLPSSVFFSGRFDINALLPQQVAIVFPIDHLAFLN